jgi:hypothetical protein
MIHTATSMAKKMGMMAGLSGMEVIKKFNVLPQLS